MFVAAFQVPLYSITEFGNWDTNIFPLPSNWGIPFGTFIDNALTIPAVPVNTPSNALTFAPLDITIWFDIYKYFKFVLFSLCPFNQLAKVAFLYPNSNAASFDEL